MSAPILPAAAQRYAKRVRAMIDDPECTGDLLAIGVALADMIDLNRDDGRNWSNIGIRVYGPKGRWSRLTHTLGEDVRRYDALADADANQWASKCGAPMVRRHGPCGKQAGRKTLITDPYTGRKQWLAACSRHAEWFTKELIARRDAASDVEQIDPPANAGGVLERHFPDLKWEQVYEWVRPGWTEPGERVEVPKLVLIKGAP